MIEIIIGLVCLFSAVVLILFKCWDLVTLLEGKKPFGYKGIFFSFILLLMAWLFFFIATASLIQYSEVITGVNEIYTITSNDYFGFTLYLQVMNFLVQLGVLLTLLESIALYTQVHKR